MTIVINKGFKAHVFVYAVIKVLYQPNIKKKSKYKIVGDVKQIAQMCLFYEIIDERMTVPVANLKVVVGCLSTRSLPVYRCHLSIMRHLSKLSNVFACLSTAMLCRCLLQVHLHMSGLRKCKQYFSITGYIVLQFYFPVTRIFLDYVGYLS